MAEKSTTLQLLVNDTLGNAIQRSISYANPNATNYVLNQFARQLNSLSTNTFNAVWRIDKEDITNATNEQEG